MWTKLINAGVLSGIYVMMAVQINVCTQVCRVLASHLCDNGRAKCLDRHSGAPFLRMSVERPRAFGAFILNTLLHTMGLEA